MKLHDTRIELKELNFYSYHGALPHERRIGNHFVVSLTVSFDATQVMQSDDLTLGVNYANLYTLVSEEMSTDSQLLEHVAHRILSRIGQDYSRITSATVSITKTTPPISGFKGHGITFTASATYTTEQSPSLT